MKKGVSIGSWSRCCDGSWDAAKKSDPEKVGMERTVAAAIWAAAAGEAAERAADACRVGDVEEGSATRARVGRSLGVVVDSADDRAEMRGSDRGPADCLWVCC